MPLSRGCGGNTRSTISTCRRPPSGSGSPSARRSASIESEKMSQGRNEFLPSVLAKTGVIGEWRGSLKTVWGYLDEALCRDRRSFVAERRRRCRSTGCRQVHAGADEGNRKGAGRDARADEQGRKTL